MVREIGIFLIAMPAVGLIMSIIARIILGAAILDCSMDLHFIMVGLVMICHAILPMAWSCREMWMV
ncbi:MAG: hypothetical protein IJ137_09860 [Eubacterium sp.]|nr:hypothetical protein [Eubacterium sp.]